MIGRCGSKRAHLPTAEFSQTIINKLSTKKGLTTPSFTVIINPVKEIIRFVTSSKAFPKIFLFFRYAQKKFFYTLQMRQGVPEEFTGTCP